MRTLKNTKPRGPQMCLLKNAMRDGDLTGMCHTICLTDDSIFFSQHTAMTDFPRPWAKKLQWQSRLLPYLCEARRQNMAKAMHARSRLCHVISAIAKQHMQYSNINLCLQHMNKLPYQHALVKLLRK